MYLTISLTIFMITLYIYYWWEVFGYWRRRGVVGPTPWPIVGNYGKVLLRLEKEVDLVRKLYNRYPNETFIGLFIGNRPILLIKDPKYFTYVLTKDFDKFSQRYVSYASRSYDKNVFTRDGDDQWKALRKVLTPILSKSTVARFDESIFDVTNKFLDYVNDIIEKEPVQEMGALNKICIRDIISEVILDTDLGRKGEFEEKAHYVEALETWEIVRVLENLAPTLMKLFKLVTSRKAKEMYSYFSYFIKESIDRCNKNATKNMIYTDLFIEAKNTKGKTMKIEDDHIIQNMVILVIASVETVSSSLALVFHRLAFHQDVQKKCHEEIDEVLQKNNGKMSVNVLHDMKYLAMVIDETLRLAGRLILLDRICQTRYKFLGTNFWINKGVYVYLPVDATHQSEKYFHDAKKFNPDRFSTQNKVKIASNAYIPFSGGPRECIGRHFARTMIWYGMAAFLQRFAVSPTPATPENLVFDSSIRIKSVVGEIPIAISRRV